MVPLPHLWLPIILAAVVVFIASALIHTVLKMHNSDYRPLPNEPDVRAALNAGHVAAGQYMIPSCPNPKDMNTPAMVQKFEEGPVGLIVLRAPGKFSMGPFLIKWFIYVMVVSYVTAYVAGRTLAPGTPYLRVFRVVGTVAFLAYSAARVQGAIWRAEPWSATVRDMVDGLIYGLLTAGVFGWLWPMS